MAEFNFTNPTQNPVRYCTKCDALISAADTACPQCGNPVAAADAQSKNEQSNQKDNRPLYRSRFKLLLLAWIGADKGRHLKWLGFEQEAKQVKAKYKVGFFSHSVKAMGDMASAMASESGSGLFSAIGSIFPFKSMMYSVKEQIAILFGKYKFDANGVPVRYFKPKHPISALASQQSESQINYPNNLFDSSSNDDIKPIEPQKPLWENNQRK